MRDPIDTPAELMVRAAPAGNLSGLVVIERRTAQGVRYAEVLHRATGVLLLHCRPTSLAQALTRLEGVDWTEAPEQGTEDYRRAVAALARACELDGVTYG